MGRKVRLPKALQKEGVWGQATSENFLNLRGLKMSFPKFSTGHFHYYKELGRKMEVSCLFYPSLVLSVR